MNQSRARFAFLACLVVLSADAYASQGYDACLKQEKELRDKESGQCTGIQYLLNPSACFSTRKALKEFDEGKCAKIGRVENAVQAPAVAGAGRQPAHSAQKVQDVPNNKPAPEHAAASTSRTTDACGKRGQELRAKEADNCSGLKYLFAPSSCFSARKQLKEFEEGDCRFAAAAPGTAASSTAAPPRAGRPDETAGAATGQMGEIDRLREENARMKAENDRLKAEMEQLRRTVTK